MGWLFEIISRHFRCFVILVFCDFVFNRKERGEGAKNNGKWLMVNG